MKETKMPAGDAVAEKVSVTLKAWGAKCPKPSPKVAKALKWARGGVGLMAFVAAIETGTLIKMEAPLMARVQGQASGMFFDYDLCRKAGEKASGGAKLADKDAAKSEAALSCMMASSQEGRAQMRQSAADAALSSGREGTSVDDLEKMLDLDWKEDLEGGAKDGVYERMPMGILLVQGLAYQAVMAEQAKGSAQGVLAQRRVSMEVAVAGMRGLDESHERARMAEAAAPATMWLLGQMSEAGSKPLQRLERRMRMLALKSYWLAQNTDDADVKGDDPGYAKRIAKAKKGEDWAQSVPMDEQGALAAIREIGPR